MVLLRITANYHNRSLEHSVSFSKYCMNQKRVCTKACSSQRYTWNIFRSILHLGCQAKFTSYCAGSRGHCCWLCSEEEQCYCLIRRDEWCVVTDDCLEVSLCRVGVRVAIWAHSQFCGSLTIPFLSPSLSFFRLFGTSLFTGLDSPFVAYFLFLTISLLEKRHVFQNSVSDIAGYMVPVLLSLTKTIKKFLVI